MLGTHINRREQRCRCGIGWQLIERMDKGSVRHWATQGENEGEMPLGAQVKMVVTQETAQGEKGGKGVSSSGDSIQPHSSDLDSSSSLLGKPRARRGRPTT